MAYPHDPSQPTRSQALRALLASALTALLFASCSGKDGSPLADPTATGLPETKDPLAAGTTDPTRTSDADFTWGNAILTMVGGTLYADGRLEIDEELRRAMAVGDVFDLDATEFFQESPCRDCAELGAIRRDGSGNIILPFTVIHPFGLGQNGRYDLHVFDTRATMIVTGGRVFPGVGDAYVNTGLNAVQNQLPQGDPDLVLGADGYTTHFDYHAENPEYGGPRGIAGNLNPFWRYFEDDSVTSFDPTAPSGWNVMPMGSARQTRDIVVNGARLLALGSVQFVIILDVSYGQSAIRTTRSTPTYYLPEFNRKEAFDVDVAVTSNNLQAGDATSRAIIDVTVKDWQQNSPVDGSYPDPNRTNYLRDRSKVKEVAASLPGVTLDPDKSTVPVSGGGTNSNPHVYRVTLHNDLENMNQQEFVGLVAVRDDLYGIGQADGGPFKIPANPGGPGIPPREGVDIRDYSSYQYFRVSVGPPVDDPPIADLSLTQPRAVLTDTTVTLDGQLSTDDLGITTWEFDPDGSGSFIDNTGAPIPWEFDFLYTTPPNTQTIYNAALRVTDTAMQQHTTSIQISVTTVPDSPPNAVITAAIPWQTFTGVPVTLDGASSTDDFGIVKYEWDPGDGTGWIDNGAAPNLSHTYIPPGMTTTYTAQLRVTDTALQTDLITRDIEVIVPDDPPVASLVVQHISPPVPPYTSPHDTILDASGSTDDFGVIEYRFDPENTGMWSPWQPGSTFAYTYIPFIDTTYTARVEVRDASLQTDIAQESFDIEVPGGCLVSGVTGPDRLNAGETITLTVTEVGILPGGYLWTALDPEIVIVGPNNLPSVDIQGVSASAITDDTQLLFEGNGGVCSFTADLTVYEMITVGPSHTRQYVNWPEGVDDTDEFGTRSTVTTAIIPSRAGVPVTFNFADPDEPAYRYAAGNNPPPPAYNVVDAETDANPIDNRGDNRRPDGTGGPGPYSNGYEDPVAPGTYLSTVNVNSNGGGVATAIFKTSRFGGDNYTFSATCDPAGNGFMLSDNAPGTLTAWRLYGTPVYYMLDGSGNDIIAPFDVGANSINQQFAHAYVEWDIVPEGTASPWGTPNGFDDMVRLDPMNTGSQFGYVENAANYAAPGEIYVRQYSNVFSMCLGNYNPGGVIGLNSYIQSGVPPFIVGQNIGPANKPRNIRNYCGVARLAMNGFGYPDTAQIQVWVHELGHGLGLPHSNTASASDMGGSKPDTEKHGASGVGIMSPAAGFAITYWTSSENDFLRGWYEDEVLSVQAYSPWYEGP